MVILTDEEISGLIAERKPLPAHLSPLGQLTTLNQHLRRDFKISATNRREFTVYIRRGLINVMDFSVVLGYQLPHVNRIFRLRRYNGKAHQHTNVIEGQTFYDYHIHTATERYQRKQGFREESFAEVTNRYLDLEGAIQCMLDDCGFRIPFEETPLGRGEAV